MILNKIFPLIMVLCTAGCSASPRPTTIPAQDAPIRWVGRTLASERGVEFDWSGTYADILFEGSRLEICLSDTGCNYFNLTVDNEEQPKFQTRGDSMSIVLFDDKTSSEGRHHIRIQKATEGEQGHLTLHSLKVNGRLLDASTLKRPRHIEYYGDSLTAGYGTESLSNNETFSIETQNCRYTYATYMARYFDADYNLVAFSGRGMVRNYGDTNPISDPEQTMSHKALRYFSTGDSPLWDFARSPYRPDAVVIMLSTNDFSTEPHPLREVFEERYRRFITTIREKYRSPELPILCVVHSPHAVEFVREVIDGMEHTAMADVSANVYNNTSDLGASFHPNRHGQMKMAQIIIPAMEQLTQWQQVNPIDGMDLLPAEKSK